MKKFIAMAVLGAAAIAAVYTTACKSSKKEPKATAQNDSLNKVIERGNYLAQHVTMCIDCHSKRDFSKYSGPVMVGSEGMGGYDFAQEVEGFPGHLYAKNITPDAETGIGSWSDEEILRAITQGINKKGDTLFPLMPYIHYNQMAKDDLLAIIAYIRTLKPINHKVPDRQLMMPLSMVYPAPVLKPSVDENKRPPETDAVNYGQYLVNASVCSDCHTPMNEKGEYDFSKMFAGGFVFKLPSNKVNTSNITPDATGLGTWSEERFMNKFTICREKGGCDYDPGSQNTTMPVIAYSGMTDTDLKAIYAFLRTVKPISNMVEKYPK
ncbi:MAG: c-type cytochrome [Chitinophagaceae bacterium]